MKYEIVEMVNDNGEERIISLAEFSKVFVKHVNVEKGFLVLLCYASWSFIKAGSLSKIVR